MALSYFEIISLDRGPVKVIPAGDGPSIEVVPAGGTTAGHRFVTVDELEFRINVTSHLEAPNGHHAVVDVDTFVNKNCASASRGILDEGRSWGLRGGSRIFHEMT